MYFVPLFLLLPLLLAALCAACPQQAVRRLLLTLGSALLGLAALALIVGWYLAGGSTWTFFQGQRLLYGAVAVLTAALGVRLAAAAFRARARLSGVCLAGTVLYLALLACPPEDGTAVYALQFDRVSAVLLAAVAVTCLSLVYVGLRAPKGKPGKRFSAGAFLSLAGACAFATVSDVLWSGLALLLLLAGVYGMLSAQSAPAALAWLKNACIAPLLAAIGSVLGGAVCQQWTLQGLARLAYNGNAIALTGIACLTIPALVYCAVLPFASWLTAHQKQLSGRCLPFLQLVGLTGGAALALRCCTAFRGTGVGFAVTLVGGVAFLAAAFLQGLQSRLPAFLLWGGVGNAGLILACCGSGVTGAIWAGLMLLLFYAVSRSLLGIYAGEAELLLGTGALDALRGVLYRISRKQAILLLVGVSGAAFAPFGVLIAQWTALQALATMRGVTGVLLLLLLCFGLAVTLYQWAGLLLLLASPPEQEPLSVALPRLVKVCLTIGTVLTILSCAGFSFLSSVLVLPAVKVLLGAGSTMLDTATILLMILMLAALLVFPLFFYFFSLDYDAEAPTPEPPPAPSEALWIPGSRLGAQRLYQLANGVSLLLVWAPFLITVVGGLI